MAKDFAIRVPEEFVEGKAERVAESGRSKVETLSFIDRL